MTGRDLILYILENGLKDKKIIDGESILGFETLTDAAKHLGCGEASAAVLCIMHKIPTLNINGITYIPAFALRSIQ